MISGFKSNPFLSLWLSGANAMAGAARGAWMAEARRQQTAMIAEASRQMMEFWSGAMLRATARAMPAPPVPAPAAEALATMARIGTPAPAPAAPPRGPQPGSRALAVRPVSRSTPRTAARKPAASKTAKAKAAKRSSR